jgi:hypothetical protein
MASAAMVKPASADGLRVAASSPRAVPARRRFRGLVVRAATVVSPKVMMIARLAQLLSKFVLVLCCTVHLVVRV